MRSLGSTLGTLTPYVTAFVIIGVIAAAIFARLAGRPDSFLDGLALAAFGVIVGTSGSLTTLNGTVKRTEEQDAEIRQLRSEVATIKADT